MKKTIAILLALITSPAFALIKGSDLEIRHQELIEKTVAKKCYLNGALTQLTNESQVDVIDQGVRDVYYTTTFETVERVDQVYYNKYLVTVKSVKWDQYDHKDQNWGNYMIESVHCEPLP